MLTKWYVNDIISESHGGHANNKIKQINMERYRSGHNGAVLKTVCLHGRMGSNPILSAENHLSNLRWFFCARGYEIPDGRSNNTEDFLIRYIWYVKLTLTQCNDEENKVKKFLKNCLTNF